MKTVETKQVLSIAEFKALVGIKGEMPIVRSERTKKLYAKDSKEPNAKIVASCSDTLDTKAECEVREMLDTDSGEEWYFVCNVTKYVAVGSL